MWQCTCGTKYILAHIYMTTRARSNSSNIVGGNGGLNFKLVASLRVMLGIVMEGHIHDIVNRLSVATSIPYHILLESKPPPPFLQEPDWGGSLRLLYLKINIHSLSSC
jgi:hypothetical protein